MSTTSIVLVTGANTGLGYQIVRALCGSEKAYEIFLGGRSLEKAIKAAADVLAEFPSTASRVSPIQIDIEDDDSIDNARQEISKTYGRLDALVNNAGAQLDQLATAGTMSTRQMWNQTWAVNTVGTQVATTAFIPLLLKSTNPRLLFITSGTSSITIAENFQLPFNKVPQKGWPKDLPSLTNIPAYRSAKAGMNMMMREWYRMLKDDGVKVWCISPGYLATGLGGNQETNKKQGAEDPAVGGEFVKNVLEGHRDGDVGKVILRSGVQPW